MLSRFMSKLAKKCLPFFNILVKEKPFKWSEDYETAFVSLKEYLFNLSFLTRSKDGENLFLYIIASDKVVVIMLIVK